MKVGVVSDELATKVVPLESEIGSQLLGSGTGSRYKLLNNHDTRSKGQVIIQHSMAFNGSFHFSVPHDELVPHGTSFSITCWLLLLQHPTGKFRTLFAKVSDDYSNRTPTVRLRPDKNTVQVGISTSNEPYESIPGTDSQIPLCVWTHVALVVHGASVRIYFDANLQKEKTMSGLPIINCEPLVIGHSVYYEKEPTDGFIGFISALNFFPHNLSQEYLSTEIARGRPEMPLGDLPLERSLVFSFLTAYVDIVVQESGGEFAVDQPMPLPLEPLSALLEKGVRYVRLKMAQIIRRIYLDASLRQIMLREAGLKPLRTIICEDISGALEYAIEVLLTLIREERVWIHESLELLALYLNTNHRTLNNSRKLSCRNSTPPSDGSKKRVYDNCTNSKRNSSNILGFTILHTRSSNSVPTANIDGDEETDVSFALRQRTIVQYGGVPLLLNFLLGVYQASMRCSVVDVDSDNMNARTSVHESNASNNDLAAIEATTAKHKEGLIEINMEDISDLPSMVISSDTDYSNVRNEHTVLLAANVILRLTEQCVGQQPALYKRILDDGAATVLTLCLASEHSSERKNRTKTESVGWIWRDLNHPSGACALQNVAVRALINLSKNSALVDMLTASPYLLDTIAYALSRPPLPVIVPRNHIVPVVKVGLAMPGDLMGMQIRSLLCQVISNLAMGSPARQQRIYQSPIMFPLLGILNSIGLRETVDSEEGRSLHDWMMISPTECTKLQEVTHEIIDSLYFLRTLIAVSSNNAAFASRITEAEAGTVDAVLVLTPPISQIESNISNEKANSDVFDTLSACLELLLALAGSWETRLRMLERGIPQYLYTVAKIAAKYHDILLIISRLHVTLTKCKLEDETSTSGTSGTSNNGIRVVGEEEVDMLVMMLQEGFTPNRLTRHKPNVVLESSVMQHFSPTFSDTWPNSESNQADLHTKQPLFTQILLDGPMAFNGTAGLEIDHEDVMPLPAQFSVTLWVYPIYNGTGNWQFVFKKGLVSFVEYSPGLWVRRDLPRFHAVVSTDKAGRNYEVLDISDSDLATGCWTHVTYVMDGSSIRLFVNGQPDGSADIVGRPVYNSGPFYIGKCPKWNGFAAYISSLELHSGILPIDHIATLASKKPNAPPPFAAMPVLRASMFGLAEVARNIANHEKLSKLPALLSIIACLHSDDAELVLYTCQTVLSLVSHDATFFELNTTLRMMAVYARMINLMEGVKQPCISSIACRVVAVVAADPLITNKLVTEYDLMKRLRNLLLIATHLPDILEPLLLLFQVLGDHRHLMDAIHELCMMPIVLELCSHYDPSVQSMALNTLIVISAAPGLLRRPDFDLTDTVRQLVALEQREMHNVVIVAKIAKVLDSIKIDDLIKNIILMRQWHRTADSNNRDGCVAALKSLCSLLENPSNRIELVTSLSVEATKFDANIATEKNKHTYESKLSGPLESKLSYSQQTINHLLKIMEEAYDDDEMTSLAARVLCLLCRTCDFQIMSQVSDSLPQFVRLLASPNRTICLSILDTLVDLVSRNPNIAVHIVALITFANGPTTDSSDELNWRDYNRLTSKLVTSKISADVQSNVKVMSALDAIVALLVSEDVWVQIHACYLIAVLSASNSCREHIQRKCTPLLLMLRRYGRTPGHYSFSPSSTKFKEMSRADNIETTIVHSAAKSAVTNAADKMGRIVTNSYNILLNMDGDQFLDSIRAVAQLALQNLGEENKSAPSLRSWVSIDIDHWLACIGCHKSAVFFRGHHLTGDQLIHIGKRDLTKRYLIPEGSTLESINNGILEIESIFEMPAVLPNILEAWNFIISDKYNYGASMPLKRALALLRHYPSLAIQRDRDNGQTLLHIISGEHIFVAHDKSSFLVSENAVRLIEIVLGADMHPIPLFSDKSGKTPLDVAIFNKEKEATRVLLQHCMLLPLEQRFVVTKALSSLAAVFSDLLLNPSLFRLSLEHAHPVVSEGCTHLNIPTSTIVTEGSNELIHNGLWFARMSQTSIRMVKSKTIYSEVPVPVEAYTLALPGLCGDFKNLKSSALHVFAREGWQDIFSSDSMRVLMEYKWKNYGQKIYLYQMMVYIIFLILFTIFTNFAAHSALNMNFDDMYFDNGFHGITMFILLIVLFTLNTAYLLFEIGQIMKEQLMYIKSFWNYVDMTAHLLTMAILPLHIAQSPNQFVFASLAATMNWFKTLSFLRGFYVTGPFVRMILRTIQDTKLFFFILLVIVFGFSNSFFLIVRGSSPNWSSLSISMLSVYRMMFGDFDAVPFHQYPDYMIDTDVEYGVFIFLFVVFLLAVAVILMNLLIALLSDSYNKVHENAANEWRLERAIIIVEIETYFLFNASRWFPKWVHVLIPSHSQWFETHEIGLSEMNRDISKHLKLSSESIQELRNDFKTIIQREITDKPDSASIYNKSGMKRSLSF